MPEAVAEELETTNSPGRTSKRDRATPHIDGFANNRGPGLGFMLGATSYLADVGPDGGALTLYPRTHVRTHRYFAQHPEKRVDGASFHEIFGEDGDSIQPLEFTAQAGDAVFWHNFTFHSGSANWSDSPRLAVFSRWHHHKLAEARYRPAGADERIWDAWGAAGAATPRL